MEISKKTWHYKLYKYVYEIYAPNNLCTYFWKLVGAILITPLLFPKFINNNILKKYIDELNTGGSILISLLGYMVLTIITKSILIGLLLGPIIMYIGFILFFLLIFSIAWGFTQIIRKFDNLSLKPKKERKYIVIEWYKGVKNKYCTPIKWKD